MACIICGGSKADYRDNSGSPALAVLHSNVICKKCDDHFVVPCGVETESQAHTCKVGQPAQGND